MEALPTGLHQQTTEDKANIRQIVKEFDIQGVTLRGRCPNCWQDAVFVLRNFFGVSANDCDGDGQPDTPHKYTYLRREAMLWRGILIDGNSPDEVVDEFVKFHPQFFKLTKDESDTADDGSTEGGGK